MKVLIATAAASTSAAAAAAAFLVVPACRKPYLNVGSANVSPIFQTKIDDDFAPTIRDIFFLSLDGTLLSNARSKAKRSIEAALQVWPELSSTALTLNMNLKSTDDECWNWLIEKLCALASITQQGNTPDKMLGCDAVFLARVLIEEQILDGGRSNGRGGKYGGKYHPGWTSDFESNGSVVGSRPLTVGELYANWKELREVMEFKYPVVNEETQRKEDPMPKIRQVLKELSMKEAAEIQQTTIQPLAYDALLRKSSKHNEFRQNALLMLGNEADLPSVLRSFVAMGLSLNVDLDPELDMPHIESWLQNQVYDGDASILIAASQNACNYFAKRTNSILVVVPDSDKGETQYDLIKRLLLDFDKQSTSEVEISVVHSSIDVMKRCKSLLGDL
jgi:hypothetical protein